MKKHSKLISGGFCAALCVFTVIGYTPSLLALNPNPHHLMQKKGITGTVVDETGTPLTGVNVVEKGSTTNGTITDIDGNFSIDAPKGSTLVFTYIGYIPQEITLKTDKILKVVLKEDTKALDEVVVVGYGTQAKKDITGSVAVVKSEDLLATPASSAAQQLQGKASGVYIGQSGSPGSPTMVRIRGIGTINDNGPLYVIDGVSTRNQNMNSINPNDIETIQVLKDASAAAIYGAQASNGVILITTKKGLSKSGGSTTPEFTYDGYVGFQKTSKRYDLLNTRDRVNLEWAAQKNAFDIRGVQGQNPYHEQFGNGTSPVFPDYIIPTGAKASDVDLTTYNPTNNRITALGDTDWWNEIDRTAPIQNHQFSISGGSDKGSYTMSVNYFDQKGTVIDSYYRRYSARANTSYNVRKWLRFGENLTLSWAKDNGLDASTGEANIYSWTFRMVPWVPVYDIMGNYAGTKAAGSGNGKNPVAIARRNSQNYWSNGRVFGNVWGEIDFWKDIKYRSNFGVDYTNRYYYRMEKKDPEFSESMNRNNFEEGAGFNFRWVWTNTVTYTHSFKEKHNLNVLLGTEAIRDGLGRSMSARRYNYLFEDDDNTWTLANGEKANLENNSSYNGEFALFGMFARVDYNYMNKYLLTGIVRRDGVSRFSPSNRYGVFPSISAGWRISEEAFMNNTRNWLDDLKIRAGLGTTGNAEIPRPYNWAYEYGTNPGYSNYDFDGSQTTALTGFKLDRFGNLDTKWEKTTMLNIGTDATFLNGKLDFNIEWYYKKTSDMLVEANYSGLAGDAGRPYINLGDMKNTGIDLTIGHNNKVGDFEYSVSANLTHYKNKVLKISDNPNARFFGSMDRISSVNLTTKGMPIGMFYGYKIDGFYENEQDLANSALPIGESSREDVAKNPKKWIGKYKYADTNGDGKINGDDKTIIGNPHPDAVIGLNMSGQYKGFDLTLFWYASIGNDIFNMTKYWTDFWSFKGNRSTRMMSNSWEPGKTDATLPILDYQDNISNNDPHSYFVEDGSFLKLKDITLGYTLPAKLTNKLTIKRLRVYVQASNLFTITKYSGLDPEITNRDLGGGGDLTKGVDFGGWPNSRKFLFGVNFNF